MYDEDDDAMLDNGTVLWTWTITSMKTTLPRRSNGRQGSLLPRGQRACKTAHRSGISRKRRNPNPRPIHLETGAIHASQEK